MMTRTVGAATIRLLLATAMLLATATALVPVVGLEAAPPQPPDDAQFKRALADFEVYAEKARQDWQVPGMAIGVVRNDRLVYTKGFGVKTAGGSDPVDGRTLFQMGSTTKAFTAALVGIQVDEGKLSWTDTVVAHLPDFQMYDHWVSQEMTIEDSMSQHSGLRDYAGDIQAFAGFDRAHILRSLGHLKPVTSFRSRFAYQNGLWLAPAAVLETVSGQPWEDSLAERIFRPLGMNDSYPLISGTLSLPEAAGMHAPRGDRVVSLGADRRYADWVDTYGPAGSIVSNVVDISKWMRLNLGRGTFEGRQLLSQESMDFIHTPKTVVGPSPLGSQDYYCLGWVYSEMYPYPMIWHTGGTSGFGTLIALVPKANMGIVILTNLAESPLGTVLALRFYDSYFANAPRDWSAEAKAAIAQQQEQVAAAMPPRPASPAPPRDLAEYAGVYINEVYGEMVVAVQDGQLAGTLGPAPLQLAFQPWDGDSFVALIMEPLNAPSLVSFLEDGNGRIGALSVAALKGEGTDTFVRTAP